MGAGKRWAPREMLELVTTIRDQIKYGLGLIKGLEGILATRGGIFKG